MWDMLQLVQASGARPQFPQLTVQRALPQYLHSRAVDASVSPHDRHRTDGPLAGTRFRYIRHPAVPTANPATSKTAATSPMLS